jgi:hypothetical protein
MAEMGEFVVGAWLREVAGCDFVDYNVRPPRAGRAGQAEFDVLGLHFAANTAYVCEVATHLDGLNYGGASNVDTLNRIRTKANRQRTYAAEFLTNFALHRFMFWSPRVPVGFLTESLSKIDGLELVINRVYADRVAELRQKASSTSRDCGNPFFRVLQILEHLR